MSEQGFSLVELLVVLVLAAMLSALALPLVSGVMDGVRMNGAAREVVAALRAARGKAAASQREVALSLNTRQATLAVAGAARRLDLPETAELSLVVARRERLSEHEGAIRFYPDGSSTGGRVSLRHGARVTLIDVNWLTGKITSADRQE